MMKPDPYRKYAGIYDRYVEPFNIVVRQIALKMYPPQKGMRVLDVGCGTGTNLQLYRQAECAVCGIDLSPAMIEVAREKLGLEADIRMGDACEMPYPDDYFDLVTAMLTLHEMDNQIRPGVIKEIARVLKPRGRILLVDFHPGPIQFPKGWLNKAVISFFEITAGRKHYKNYRNFLSNRGLPGLVSEDRFVVDKKKIVSGGNLALFLIGLA
jgi:ubiquinone/menaquinone biosynthesis C-methylase UbiE